MKFCDEFSIDIFNVKRKVFHLRDMGECVIDAHSLIYIPVLIVVKKQPAPDFARMLYIGMSVLYVKKILFFNKMPVSII